MSSQNRVSKIVARVRELQGETEGKGAGWKKKLTDGCGKLALSERKKLNVITDKKSGELIGKPNCSYRYYCQLMEAYRNAIKALGYKHHLIESRVKAFINKYLSVNDQLPVMLDTSLPIEQLRDNLILLRAKAIKGSDYKNDLLHLKIEHHAYYLFEPQGAVKEWISLDDTAKLNEKLNNQVRVNPEWIKKLASDLLSKKTPTAGDLCIGLALATGRRLTEIMKTAKLVAQEDGTLSFSGQLKTKNRHLFEDISSYNIPSLVKAEVVVKALRRLRKLSGNDKLIYPNVLGEKVEKTLAEGGVKDYDHNKAVHKRYESTMNRKLKISFRNGYFSLKDCRAIYAEITYSEHAKEGESRSVYRQRVLGHSLLETQLHYESFELDDSVETIKLTTTKTAAAPQHKLVEYLSQVDGNIQSYKRSPKIALIHEWLKNEVKNGLQYEQITPAYIRKHCLVDGKQLNFLTVKGYFGEETNKYKGPTVDLPLFKNL